MSIIRGTRLLLCAALLITAIAGVPLRSSGPSLMRTKDGKPIALPLPRRDPVPSEGSRATAQRRLDTKELVRSYIDDLLIKEIKRQVDRTNLQKSLTEMLMWRKTIFDTAV